MAVTAAPLLARVGEENLSKTILVKKKEEEKGALQHVDNTKMCFALFSISLSLNSSRE